VKLHGLTPMASSLTGFRNGAKPCTECHSSPLLRTGHSGTWVNLNKHIFTIFAKTVAKSEASPILLFYYFYSKRLFLPSKTKRKTSKHPNLPKRGGISSLSKKPTGIFFCQSPILTDKFLY